MEQRLSDKRQTQRGGRMSVKWMRMAQAETDWEQHWWIVEQSTTSGWARGEKRAGMWTGKQPNSARERKEKLQKQKTALNHPKWLKWKEWTPRRKQVMVPVKLTWHLMHGFVVHKKKSWQFISSKSRDCARNSTKLLTENGGRKREHFYRQYVRTASIIVIFHCI